jgi:NAD/NADP transhydrogenase alpha subunit
MPQLIGVPRETFADEKRVATVPEVVERLLKLGFRVAVEAGAGAGANFSDEAYRAAGAEIAADAGPARTSCSRCAPPVPRRSAGCARARP